MRTPAPTGCIVDIARDFERLRASNARPYMDVAIPNILR